MPSLATASAEMPCGVPDASTSRFAFHAMSSGGIMPGTAPITSASAACDGCTAHAIATHASHRRSGRASGEANQRRRVKMNKAAPSKERCG
ncbi:hypothetical protein [Candidatus Burkholderia verschuerenii]|uniref:hypothetical protein n=1 Tax=Candidatus Burkholderia verschuerenii TaxID=242163 RepID=UPI0018DE3FAD|nr:hypothetical protein [Candidatus Burkholderia verschuerenii]